MTRGVFEWESEGYPWWSVLRQVQTWLDFRHLPNMMLVHYADLLADIEDGIKRIASFLDTAPSGEVLRRIVSNCTLSEMRNRAAELSRGLQANLKGGANTFFFKGPNGRWREV